MFVSKVLLVHLHFSEDAILTWDGAGIMANMAGTSLGMYFGSRIWPASPEERVRAKHFLARMDLPVLPGEVVDSSGTADSSGMVGFATAIVGLLLVIAGAISGVRTARIVDLGCGGILAVAGINLMVRKRWGRRKVSRGSV
jgi:hypothetical protein